MSTLLSAYDGGVCYGRCDAKCYGSTEVSADKCDCICGGVNHGVGLDAAMQNTRALAGQWKKRERLRRRSRKVHFEMNLIDQAVLF